MEQRNEPALEKCACCGKPIPLYEGICEDCERAREREFEAFQMKLQAEYKEDESDGAK